MEILMKTPTAPVAAVLMDFDGTVSTLRFGWDQVMRAMMLEMIPGGEAPDPELVEKVDQYLDQSAGIQTIYQMKWLMAQVLEQGKMPNPPQDPWWYKDQYNQRLMAQVEGRIQRALAGAREEYLMAGATDFLAALQARGVPCYVASGTDDQDVRREAAALGVTDYFARIAGAPARVEGCAKEAALKMLVEQSGFDGAHIGVIGDGKVEIALGRVIGARTLGLASDEAHRRGVDPVKRARLVAAGAQAIAGDYLELNALLDFLGLEAI